MRNADVVDAEWSPDGRTIAYATNSGIFVVDAWLVVKSRPSFGGAERTALVGPTWSPR